MIREPGRKTTPEHWEATWSREIRMRLPSSLHVGVRDLKRLIRHHVTPGDSYIEFGCAPGKMLAWVAAELNARVAGLDYSERGIESARQLFEALQLTGDLRCEDAFDNTFLPRSFDVAASFGLVEHFDDPTQLIRQHLRLLRPNGIALIAVPNYGGLYGRLQRHFDPENLAIHNLAIMTPGGFSKCVPKEMVDTFSVFYAGKMSPWMVTLSKRLPHIVATGLTHTLNVAGLLQPVSISALCPLLVLRAVRRG